MTSEIGRVFARSCRDLPKRALFRQHILENSQNRVAISLNGGGFSFHGVTDISLLSDKSKVVVGVGFRMLGERMLTHLKALFAGKTDTAGNDKDDLQLATAALLLEAAVLDGHFDEAERAVIETLLSAHFGLNAADAHALIDTARTAIEESGELYGFTRTVKDSYEPEDRIVIIEMLWRVALADGEVHDYEANLVRRVAGLIYVSDMDSGLAKKRVLAEQD